MDHDNEQRLVPFPNITVGWDAQRQLAVLKFDPKEFRTWDFVIAVLEMAQKSAEDSRRLSQMAAMQQQAAQAQRDAQIAAAVDPKKLRTMH